MPLLLLNMLAFTVTILKMVYHSIVIAHTLGLNCATPQAKQRVSLNETAESAEADHNTLTFCTCTPHTLSWNLGVHHARIANNGF